VTLPVVAVPTPPFCPPGPWDDWRAALLDRARVAPENPQHAQVAQVVAQLVERHSPGHDGLIPQSLALVLEQCALAHLEEQKRGSFDCLTLEIGAYKGATTLAILELMRCLHPADRQPLVVTVDPYGGKPYNGGNTAGIHTDQLYGDPIYGTAKTNLAAYTNHAHFLLTGEDFLRRCMGARYWQLGEPRVLNHVTFAFVDGDHDAHTIVAECQLLIPLMRPGARLVVDNVDMDTHTVNELQGLLPGVKLSAQSPRGALQAYWAAP